jgi:hypothetical protein
MRKIRIYIITILALGLSGCTQSFLNTQDLTQKTNASFYQTPTDAVQALAAIYSILPGWAPQSIFITSEQMSDECFGGGGQNDHAGGVDQFQETSVNEYEDTWSSYYQGIFRANSLIKNFNQITGWNSDNQKNQMLGEAKFLRAYYYFDLMRMFGGPVGGKMMGVPLIIDPANPTPKRASVDDVYAQIASDLKDAISELPAVTFQAMDKSTIGHATKWAAEALMARVFLFYNGEAYGRNYSQLGSNATMPLVGGGTIKNSDVVGWIDDCALNSGHALISDFRNLWPYSYVPAKGVSDYGYARNNHLHWIGENGANTESVFQINFSNLATYNTYYYANQIDLYCGWRNQTQLPFGTGWGWNTVSTTVWNSWDNSDLRKRGSIFNANDSVGEGVSGYVWGGDKQMWETGCWQKKYMPINIKAPDGHYYNYSCELYGTPENYMLDETQDIMIIRFADVLLMGAELGSSHAQQYLDMVRTRVGLPSVPVTLANIQAERQHEFAFEGIRYWDELRWGTLTDDLTAESGIPIMNAGVWTTYTPPLTRLNETKGFLPIPQQEISLSAGQLVQNDGWNQSDDVYSN